VALVVAGAALGALILGEYELTFWTSLASGVVLGVAAGELLLTVGRWHGSAAAAIASVAAAAAVGWAGRIDANFGIDPYPKWAWVGVAVAALTGAGRVLVSSVAPDEPARSSVD
jgi:hypothetical protein